MNEFESVLSTVLRAEAEEISMNVDMQKAADSIDVRIDRAERRQRRQSWMAVAAAAVAVVAIVLGVRIVGSRGSAESVGPPKPSSSPMTVTTSTMTPNFTIALPGWTRDVPLAGIESDTGQAGWSQKDCSQLPTRLCPVGEDLRVRFFSVRAMYRPQDGPTVTSDPTYAQYVAYIASLPATGAATVSPPTTLTVGGRPATEFSVTPILDESGAIACVNAFEARPDCYSGLLPGRENRLVVVDQGRGVPPTVITFGMNASNPDQAALTAEFQQSLASVVFEK
jgi:hypothetical protein